MNVDETVGWDGVAPLTGFRELEDLDVPKCKATDGFLFISSSYGQDII